MFINGVQISINDDGTTWVVLHSQQFDEDKPKEVGRFIMSETTALMIAEGILSTHRQMKEKRGAVQ